MVSSQSKHAPTSNYWLKTGLATLNAADRIGRSEVPIVVNWFLQTGFPVGDLRIIGAKTSSGANLPAVCIPTSGNINTHLSKLEQDAKSMDYLRESPCGIFCNSETRTTGLTDKALVALVQWIKRTKLNIKSLAVINSQVTQLQPVADLVSCGRLDRCAHLHFSDGNLIPESVYQFLVEMPIEFTLLRVEGNCGVAAYLLSRRKTLPASINLLREKTNIPSIYTVFIGNDLTKYSGEGYRQISSKPMFSTVDDYSLTLKMFGLTVKSSKDSSSESCESPSSSSSSISLDIKKVVTFQKHTQGQLKQMRKSHKSTIVPIVSNTPRTMFLENTDASFDTALPIVVN
jgi:hypothetical protein